MNNTTKDVWESLDPSWYSGKCFKKILLGAMLLKDKRFENDDIEYRVDLITGKEIGFYKNDRKFDLFSKKYLPIFRQSISENSYDYIKKVRTENSIDHFKLDYEYKQPKRKARCLLLHLRSGYTPLTNSEDFANIAKEFGINSKIANAAYHDFDYPFQCSFEDIRQYAEKVEAIIEGKL